MYKRIRNVIEIAQSTHRLQLNHLEENGLLFLLGFRSKLSDDFNKQQLFSIFTLAILFSLENLD